MLSRTRVDIALDGGLYVVRLWQGASMVARRGGCLSSLKQKAGSDRNSASSAFEIIVEWPVRGLAFLRVKNTCHAFEMVSVGV